MIPKGIGGPGGGTYRMFSLRGWFREARFLLGYIGVHRGILACRRIFGVEGLGFRVQVNSNWILGFFVIEI